MYYTAQDDTHVPICDIRIIMHQQTVCVATKRIAYSTIYGTYDFCVLYYNIK